VIDIRQPDRVTDPSALPSPERVAYLLTVDLADDDVGLWQVVWGLDVLAPAALLADKITLARRAVTQSSGDRA
jgi:hypothetical protein